MATRRSPRLARSRTLVALVAAGAAALASPGAWSARDAGADEVLAGLQNWLDGTRDLQGRFEQTLVSGALGTGLVESGELFIARPGRMRWNYEDPERKVAIIEGDLTRLYIEQDQQLWHGRLDESDSLLPRLLAAPSSLSELFEFDLVGTPGRGGKGSYRLRLKPRGASDSFEEVVLVLRPKAWSIEAVEVIDGTGNRVRYRFEALRRNDGLSDSVFYFEPPVGTRIVAAP